MSLALPSWFGRTPDAVDALLGVLAFATLAPAVVGFASRGLDLLSPVPMMGGLVALYFVYRTLILRYGSPQAHQLAPALLGYYDSLLAPALELVLVCWLAALLGYFSPLGDTIARTMPKLPMLTRDVAPARVMVLWAIGLVGRAWQVARGTHLSFAKPEDVDQGLQGVADYVTRLAVIAFFIMVTLHYKKALKGPFARIPMHFMLPVEVGWGLITGSRLAIIYPFILILIARHDWHARIRLSQVATLFAVVTFVVIPIGGAFRSAQTAISGNQVTQFDVGRSTAAARQASGTVSDLMDGDYATLALGDTSGRLHGIDSVMACLKQVPAFLPWESNELYLLLPAMALVPRFLWPSKPQMVAVPDFNSRYWGLPFGDPSSVAVSHVGSLYVAFGWWGAVIGMAVLGVVWQFLYAYFRGSGGVIGHVIYLNLQLVIISIENDVPGVYSYLLKMLVVMVLVGKFVGRTSSGSAVSSTAFGLAPTASR